MHRRVKNFSSVYDEFMSIWMWIFYFFTLFFTIYPRFYLLLFYFFYFFFLNPTIFHIFRFDLIIIYYVVKGENSRVKNTMLCSWHKCAIIYGEVPQQGESGTALEKFFFLTPQFLLLVFQSFQYSQMQPHVSTLSGWYVRLWLAKRR